MKSATVLLVTLGLVPFLVLGCTDADAAGSPLAATREDRRLFDGAPPVIPHADFGPRCTACHTERGMEVPDVGYAVPMPHDRTLGMSPKSRCTQCHAFKTSDDVFVATVFEPLRQAHRRRERLNALAPPTIPHPLLMRESCLACHDGPAAREEIRCSHPERTRCTQCHVPRRDQTEFRR